MTGAIMRYNTINSCECTNGLGWGVSLFTQGCSIHCKGCFNPETWNFEGGKEVTTKVESELYKLMDKSYIKRFSVLGGEPLSEQNLEQLSYLIVSMKANYPNKKIWIWTGYTWDEIQERLKKPTKLWIILRHTDYLVAGPFIQEEKDLTLKWRGSRNQEIIKLKNGKKV